MIHTAREGQWLTVYSMEKRFRVRAIATTDEEANKFCARNRSTGVIACFGPFIVIANLYEGEAPQADEWDLITALQEAKKLAEWKRDHAGTPTAMKDGGQTADRLAQAIDKVRERRLKSNGDDNGKTQA